MTYTTLDFETTIRQSFKRKANPFDTQNFVVMQGYKRKGGPVIGEYFGRGKKPFDWFTKVLAGTSMLVGMNIKFDILYAMKEPQNREAWMKWVAGGGIVWDVQLAEYLLNGMGMEDQYLSMDELAPRYGGNLKFDEVKALWMAGVCTADIDEDLLRRYLCGTDTEHGDIGNTELIFLAQLERAKAAKQGKSIIMNMGSLLCTIEMEYNGMAVDKDLAMQHAEELTVILSALKTQLAAFLPADLPPEIDFKWTNRYHLSPLIFGGRIKYEKRMPVLDELGQPTYSQKKVEHFLCVDGSTIDKPTYYGLADGSIICDADSPPDLQYFAGGLKKGEPKTKQVTVDDLDKPKTRMEDQFYSFPRMTEPKPQWASSTEGLYSVAADVIEELGLRDIPFLEAFAKVASASKDLTTYYITTDEKTGQQKGMLTLVDELGIIHHSINHVNTVTGRFSSSDPNLQNVSKGEVKEDGSYKGSRIKLCFVSRWREKGRIVQSDFTALEVYVQAILTKCTQLILDLKAGLDMHCKRVSAKEGITYEEALLRCKGTSDAEGNELIAPLDGWPKKRQGAKEFSFQRAYGAGAGKISETTKIPLDDVKALIVAEDKMYPEIPKFYEDLTREITKGRQLTGRKAPHPENPNVFCQFGRSYSRTPDGKLYAYQESPTPGFIMKKTGQTQGFSPTEIKNYIVQGTGGEVAKAAMWLAIRAFYKRGCFGDLALLVNQVHDALYGDFHQDVCDEASALLQACMEAASDWMEYYFGWYIPVPVPSVTEVGMNMMQAKECKAPEWKARVKELRTELRKEYMQGFIPKHEQE